ncbi:MAG: penicillin-binding protein 1A [Rhodospirillaceae bacterium]|nr:penicillin-binding protein 1A [Rhodospirillaceae bacterium]
MVAVAGTAVVLYKRYSADLPDYQKLASYEPPIVSRVYANDGRLIAEYATENRFFVPISAIPKRVIDAFLAAEDKTFYSHPGLDIPGIIRAVLTNLAHRDRRPIGASTITQQVAKNFLLSSEVSYERKIKEMILALRIERAFTKDHILELYLNQIYLGQGAYGVAAAALEYFNKSLDELTLGEAAYLAALPKAPNNYNLIRQPQAAKDRRDWVIDRMLDDGFITAEEAQAAKTEPLVAHRRDEAEVVHAAYFAEELRRELVQRFGEKALYEGGLSVRSTLDPKLQEICDRVLTKGLMAYDMRHGWRGPLAHVELGGGDDWAGKLAAVPRPPGLNGWRLAVVRELDVRRALVGFADGTTATLPFAEMAWARPWRPNQTVGPAPKKPSDVLSVGDVVAVEPVSEDAKGNPYPEGTVALRQIPDVSGAMVVMDPHTGRVLALKGGWSYEMSEFDRATQARRQPGSAFKPFVYMTALDNGFTPSSIIVDAPIVLYQGPGLPLWKPENYEEGRYYGPSTLRTGLEKSRNLMTVRLAQTVGMDKIAAFAEKLGIVKHMPPLLAMSLGSGETTVLDLTTAYGMIVNGGKRITPTLIGRVQDREGHTVYRHDNRPCPDCRAVAWEGQAPPQLPDTREQVIDPGTAYQMVSLLQGVIQRGTGSAVKKVGKPLAGKTGTTNDYDDAWFVGFSPDLVVGVYVGFDTPRTLGHGESGGVVAAPIFRDFMMEALADKPAVPFRVPPGIRLVRVNVETGQRASASDPNTILEAFKPGTDPSTQTAVLEHVAGEVDPGSGWVDTSKPLSNVAPGGLY